MASKVLVLRTSDKDGKSHGGFQWPASGPVECPDWDPRPQCGNGLHGLLWGEGNASLMSDNADALWQVVEVVADCIIQLDGKVKFPRGTVIYSGARHGALKLVLLNKQRLDEIRAVAAKGDGGASATTGDYAHSATTGDSAHSATTGDYAHSATTGNYAHSATTGYSAHSATTGDYAHSATTGDSAHSATTGYSAHSATTGDYAHSATTGKSAHSATTGDYAHSATTGENSVAAALGREGQVKAGEKGVIVAGYYDQKTERHRVLVGYVGEDGIEADTWYEVKVYARGGAKWKAVKR